MLVWRIFTLLSWAGFALAAVWAAVILYSAVTGGGDYCDKGPRPTDAIDWYECD